MLLVDAHNVLYRDGDLRRLMTDAERGRAALEHLLSGSRDLMLFYDGGPGGEPSTTMRGGLRIAYSGAGEADDAIVAWLRAHPGTRTAVVTDDRELRARCRTLGARLVAVDDFLARLRKPRTEDRPKPEPDDADVDYWMQVFSRPKPPDRS